jgi:hypothetical protein
MKIVYDVYNSRVVTEDDSRNVFYTTALTCPDELIEQR